MDKVFCKRPFMKLQLLVITGITVFMFIPPTFSCEITEVTLYAGADAPDAEEADCETFYIGKNGDVVFHAICEGVTNPDELEIKWKFNFDNGGTTVDYSDETSYDSDGDYLKKTSSTANYDTAGTKSPSVTCYLIDSDGNQVGNSVSDTCTVYVVSVNIEMQSLGEEGGAPPHEEDPGAFVGKNDNDSDVDGIIDLSDISVAGGDPDLVPATLSITPSGVDVGEIVLSPSAGTTIKVYENQDKSGGEKYSWDLSSASAPGRVYVEGFETGTENLKMTFKYDNDDDGDDDELCDDQVKVTVVRADLDIYNGQSGPLAPETDHDGDAIEDEEDIGAFTVANLNDTNGDEVADKDQNPVLKYKKPPASTYRGRNEIDLMKLVLNKPSPDCGGDVKLTVLSGDVKIWSDGTDPWTDDSDPDTNGVKKTEVTSSDYEFPVSNFTGGTIKWWVEARSSTSLQGIKLKYEYKPEGATSWVHYDKVAATGIWTSCTKVCSANRTAAQVDAYMGMDYVDYSVDTRDAINALNGTGVNPSEAPYQNVILFEYTVYPSNINTVPVNYGDSTRARPYFDLTRQANGASFGWLTGLTNEPLSETVWFSVRLNQDNEKANDDGSDYGETDEPTDDGHMWVMDEPGFYVNVSLNVQRVDFKEYMRMGINNYPWLSGNGVEGSRCSDWQEWHNKTTKTDEEDWPCANVNEIGTGHFTFEPEALQTIAERQMVYSDRYECAK